MSVNGTKAQQDTYKQKEGMTLSCENPVENLRKILTQQNSRLVSRQPPRTYPKEWLALCSYANEGTLRMSPYRHNYKNDRRVKIKLELYVQKAMLIYTTEIEYRCSEAPTSQIWLLGECLFEAVQSSHQWKWERNLGGLTTDCLNALVPENRQDISITLVVGHEKGVELIDKFILRTL
jgi:hypothetical protein